ncbi:TPR-like protein [Athelia psychrophila]|uniref:TPR-like protein n=1 Tax=Athelia psychrophila TaxID=1759441 RepID=A0A166L5C5_9AGAM|nr:TPR-like protein [Fibularhizoctonia sp. CBS 109695]
MYSLAPFNDAPVDRISSFFMGREGDMDAIASAVNSCDGDAPSRFAVWGMPGLGKSQLALSYANASFTAGSHTHIIWIPATTLEKVNQGLVKVLDLTQHVDRNNPDQGARLTAGRLCLERFDQRLKWLIILDDVTPATLHFLREHLPRRKGHGSILITTRTLEVAKAVTSVAGQQHPVHELKALSTQKSVALLFKNEAASPTPINSKPCMIKGDWKRYFALIVATIKRANKEFKIIGWDNSLSTYQEKSVLTTVTVQLQTLGNIDPHLLMLLQVLAFFDPESIPLDIIILGARRVSGRPRASEVFKTSISLIPEPIRPQIGQVSGRRYRPSRNVLLNPNIGVVSADVSVELRPLLELVCSDKWLRGALRHLEDLSLAQPRYGKKISLHLHDLIQLVLQQSTMANRLDEDPHCALAVILLCGAFETIRIENVRLPHSWAEYERFVPHLMALSKHAGKPTLELLSMNAHVASYFFRRCRYSEAEALYQTALAGQEEQLGAEHPSTLHTADAVASLYRDQGRYTEAGTLYERTLERYEQRLGADHPSTLETVNNFALLYAMQGKYDEVEILYQRALAGKEQQLGGNHPSTLGTANNLAVLCQNQGKYEEAEALYQRALTGREHQLGPDHPDTLDTVNNIAALYEEQCKYAKAETLYQRALAFRERQLGADHLATLGTVNNLAILYEVQGKCAEAETLYRRALAGKEQQLGADHPSTLTTVNNIALVYEKQDKYAEAETLYQRALVGKERQLGRNHPSTLNTVDNLGWLYVRWGKHEKAEALCQRAMEGFERQLGADHPDTLAAVNNLGMLYEKQGKYTEAELLFQRALAGMERQLGGDHPSTLNIVSNLGWLYTRWGKNKEAENLCQRALAGLEQQLGGDHLNTLEATNNLANLRVQQDRLEEAETLFNRALAGRVKTIGVRHTDTIASMEDLARLHEKQGRFEEARMMRDEALQRT